MAQCKSHLPNAQSLNQFALCLQVQSSKCSCFRPPYLSIRKKLKK
nr:MAG TPA: hypothetical protein [Bacteriophage sp.]DAX88291.1 MAG TPA: hypothetical protein [Caudoviricetes sp.]